MKNIRFMCVQPAINYYAWQVEVMINNFIKNGINPNYIDVICATSGKIPDVWSKLASHYNYVRFFFYPDDRINPCYISSIRPNILKKHFKQHPELKNEYIFYHDCDVVFTKPFNFNHLLQDDIWYLSDTRFYISSEYIKSKKFGIYEKMCEIVGINQKIPEQNELNSGGAQYLIKNVDHIFWEKVEEDSETLYSFFLDHLREHPETPEYHPIQKWTADMWAVLWNAWYFGHETRIDKILDFAWATSGIEEWNKCYLYHNAGVLAIQKDEMFFKGEYQSKLPYEIKNIFNDKRCSFKYVNEILETAKKSCLL